MELRFAASLFDDPVRPILRFWTGRDVYQDHLLPAPCEGAASWIGRVPDEATDVWISPTNRIGRFDFVVTNIGPVAMGTLVRKALRSPRRMFYAVSAHMVGLRQEADLNLRYALGANGFSSYPEWRALRSRAPDFGSIDRPRTDWATGPKISLLVRPNGAARSALDATCRSIAGQHYANWRVLFCASTEEETEIAAEWLQAPGFDRLPSDPSMGERECDWIAVLNAGDTLAPHALACFVEHIARHEDEMVVYADHVRIGPGGELEPEWKPGWSPTLQQEAPYVGRAALYRPALLAQAAPVDAPEADGRLGEIIANRNGLRVARLGRPLFYFPDGQQSGVQKATRAGPKARGAGRQASVAIVVPTRDRAELLEPCLESLSKRSSYREMRIVVVDNGSVQPRTHRLLDRLREEEPRLEVLHSPGPFNFSSLCNQGAHRADGEYLVFLNNDTTIVSPDWIEELMAFAERPDVGAVGAKLLYPQGVVQHAGVVLGMGGVAGHFGAGLREDAAGWLRRNEVPHEASAVTGACLMVERSKFQAIGGFDEINLPVELNDVDLCLRLAERGWRTICNPRAKLVHHESASRGGASFRLQKVYEKERDYFRQRWMERIRDDPYFHPGFSLYEKIPALL